MSSVNSEQVFEWAMEFVLAHEGDGFDDDEQDPGGFTAFGVSQVHHPDVDVATLDTIGATRIYRKDYWEAYRCGELHPSWALPVFDGVVNQPGKWIITQLQATVGAKVDGIIGPQTIGMANSVRGNYFLEVFFARRLQRYISRPHFDRFGNGWMRRMLDCYATARARV